ncbi:invasion protein [Hyphomicrobium sp. xq]|uniref:Invasion protein n=1 Tax=Hyphomicrobium album TaxID=2665159 RepID=A0A6I3KHQ4_9HYPH|nr:invasion associated locus B family protein [Hyphomicrobium album]MTD93227.1 invasion protein [Hyphomicrobium album]
MTNNVAHLLDKGRSARGVAAVCAALGLAAMIAGTPALAQDPAAKAPAAAPAAKAPAAGAPAAKGAPAAAAGNKSAWVKLCEKAPFNTKDKDGKEVKNEKNICLTHHERLDGNTGMVMVSAAIREIEGIDKKSMMVMVPLGMALPPGLRAAVYTKEQWAAAAKNEKIDEKALKPLALKYSLCHAAGCTAEVEATAELIESMKTGGGIMVIAMNAGAQPIGFPVPLDGFTEAFGGKPVDNKEYAKARGQLMAQIRERQQAALEKYKAEQMKNLPPPPADAAAPAAAPAAKK